MLNALQLIQYYVCIFIHKVEFLPPSVGDEEVKSLARLQCWARLKIDLLISNIPINKFNPIFRFLSVI